MAEDIKVEEKAEEKHTTEFKVDISGMTALIEKQNAVIAEMSNKLDIMAKERQTPSIVPEVKDKTVGIVKEEVKVEEKKDDGLVLEKADFGKGFQIWRNYNKYHDKLKRLSR